MRLTKNPRWKPPVWTPPLGDSREIVADYSRMIEALPGVLGVWALLERASLRIYTLIQPDDEATENAVYKAEMAIMDKWPESPVSFHVSMDVDGFAESMASVEPFLIPLH